ncbi:hypothetical protein GCM10010191_49780 [Actinomadura vinacea]|uniref:Uncharacterized protein n=1 Tax=Actinomadura vinacea TaxID=115336 RepID=A0ABN3JJK9_9ACTN
MSLGGDEHLLADGPSALSSLTGYPFEIEAHYELGDLGLKATVRARDLGRIAAPWGIATLPGLPQERLHTRWRREASDGRVRRGPRPNPAGH